MEQKLGITKGLKKSLEWHKRAEKVIPACSQLLSRGPYVHPFGAYPIYIEKGKGSHVWDVDGNEYIDWSSALGPTILGYCHPAVNKAIERQLKKGLVFSLEGTLQVELAEFLYEIIPCAEMVRFGKHGSDATSMAVKCARSYTGREKIAYCGYHGWQDWFVVTGVPRGIPKAYMDYIFRFEYNKIETLEKIFSEHQNEIAGVIMEPTHDKPPEKGFLAKVKELAHKNGALFILDEVITGFRFGLGGAQEYFKVIPDLATFGKAIANGMPLSALVGRREFMEEFDFGKAFFSSTFGSELASMAAAIATLNFLKNTNAIENIWSAGRAFKNRYNETAKIFGLSDGLTHRTDFKTECRGYPPFLTIAFEGSSSEKTLILKSYFLQETAKRGILFGHIQLPNEGISTEEVARSNYAVLEVLSEMAKIGQDGLEKHLTGEVIKTVF